MVGGSFIGGYTLYICMHRAHAAGCVPFPKQIKIHQTLFRTIIIHTLHKSPTGI